MLHGIEDKDNKFTKNLINAFLSLENEQQCRELLYELFTDKEISSIAQRYEVATMLAANALYSEISQKTGANGALIHHMEDTLCHSIEYRKACLNEQKREETNIDDENKSDCKCDNEFKSIAYADGGYINEQ